MTIFIDRLKSTIEHVRMVRAIRGEQNLDQADPEEQEARQELEKEKLMYVQS